MKQTETKDIIAQSMCIGKRSYPTYTDAIKQSALRKSGKRHRKKTKLHPYKCHICRHWHVGNNFKPNYKE